MATRPTLSARRNRIQIVKIEKRLSHDLIATSGYVGRVSHIYQNGFDLLRNGGRLIHLRNGKWLASPFGMILDRPVGEWIRRVSLKVGDVFHRQDRWLQRETGERGIISFDLVEVIDLQKILSPTPPGPETLKAWIQILAENILQTGRFEGIGGSLILLKRECPGLFPDSSIPQSFWSRHALKRVAKLVESVKGRNSETFQEAYEGLLGLGPGVTPAGDDFLVGLLAAHTLFSSSFRHWIEKEGLTMRMREKIDGRTSRVASQFLGYALKGLFSETLYRVFEELTSQIHGQPGADRSFRGEDWEGAIHDFLQWGHSSGTDALTGVVFGFRTMM